MFAAALQRLAPADPYTVFRLQAQSPPHNAGCRTGHIGPLRHQRLVV